jgi:hypothetical protein
LSKKGGGQSRLLRKGGAFDYVKAVQSKKKQRISKNIDKFFFYDNILIY